MIELDLPGALARARELGRGSRRVILGITGPPGAGKSTLAQRVVEEVAGAVLVGMDGFHLAHSTLVSMGTVERKGALDTFDGPGYVNLVARLRSPDGFPVWAPEFRREMEDAVAGAVLVDPSVGLVVTEGNYLLVPEEPWGRLRELLDEVWYVEVPEMRRHQWLTARHESFGRSAPDAKARTLGSDQANAEVVRKTRGRADVVVRLD